MLGVHCALIAGLLFIGKSARRHTILQRNRCGWSACQCYNLIHTGTCSSVIKKDAKIGDGKMSLSLFYKA